LGRPQRLVRLGARLDMTYFSLTMSFVEESALAFGMGAADTLKLRLASEEIFAYLAESDQKGEAVNVEAEDGLYYVGVKFLLEAPHSDAPVFRFPETGSPEPGMDLAHMGLIIASRSVDRLNMLHDAAQGYGVGLVKEKTYPEIKEPAGESVRALQRYQLSRPDSETLKYFTRRVTAHYSPDLFPVDFRFPGKVADMVAHGQYHVLVATDGGADVAGGIMWRTMGARMIEAFGPYLFDQPQEYGMAEALVNRLIEEVAKTEALCLIDIYATPELPEGYFEWLGSIDRVKPDGERMPWPFYYRQLKEDPGLSVWAHPDLTPFLETEYDRLFLARDICATSGGGEGRPAHSLFSLRFDRVMNSVILRLIWDGVDAPGILDQHIKSLKAEGFSEIFFEIDLAHPWEVNLSAVLIQQGFFPRLLFPHAGKADVVAFQYLGQY
jgi:hypothetical protein